MKISQIQTTLFDTQQYFRDTQPQVAAARHSPPRLQNPGTASPTHREPVGLQSISSGPNTRGFSANEGMRLSRRLEQAPVPDCLVSLPNGSPNDFLFDPAMSPPTFSPALNELDTLLCSFGHVIPAAPDARTFSSGVGGRDGAKAGFSAPISTCVTSLATGAVPSHLLTIASDGLKYIRGNVYKVGFGAANKRNIRKYGRDSEEKRLKEASDEVVRLRNLQDGSTRCNAALYALGHVCDELAEAAYAYLKGGGEPVTIINSNGHTFLAVGTLPAGEVEDDMLKWPVSVAICDPWLNIACTARDYPTLFLEKMEKWALGGKEIYDRRGWFSPRDRTWIEGVVGGTKRRKVL